MSSWQRSTAKTLDAIIFVMQCKGITVQCVIHSMPLFLPIIPCSWAPYLSWDRGVGSRLLRAWLVAAGRVGVTLLCYPVNDRLDDLKFSHHRKIDQSLGKQLVWLS